MLIRLSQRSAIDQHAAKETTTVYTGVRNFSMLPEQLSTGMTSLLEGADKLSLVIEFVVGDGCVSRARRIARSVRNKAQLTYDAVGVGLRAKAWFRIKWHSHPNCNLSYTSRMKSLRRSVNERYRHGALNIETTEVRPVLLNQQVVGVVKQEKNRATELIEDFMIAANGVVARMLLQVSSIRRVVKTPERWNRIVELAAQRGEHLPAEAGFQGAERVLDEAQDRGPGSLRRSVIGGDQVDGAR